jgi:S-formylglutathione hydrolase FrmB
MTLFKLRIGLIFQALLFCYFTFAQSQIHQSLSIKSEHLDRIVNYSVYLPPSYFDNENKTEKVFYLLHGYGGDNNSWIVRCKIQNLLDSLINTKTIPEMVVVMPDGDNTYFINDYKGENNYEDFFITEFVPFINKKYSTDSSSKSIICGLSMGGFGAVVLSTKHPETFSTTISLSGAIRTPEIFATINQTKYEKYFGGIFGNGLIGEERITDHWKNNSPYFLIDSIKAEKLKDMNWYIDCGMQDFLFPSNKAFHELLLKYNIPHEYHMRIGKHNWAYWKRGIILALQYLSENNK